MVYLVGIIGFIFGFAAGQKLLLHLLRDYSNKEILENPSIRWKFGTINWGLSIFGAFLAVWFYNFFL
jgi:hypothetical protein